MASAPVAAAAAAMAEPAQRSTEQHSTARPQRGAPHRVAEGVGVLLEQQVLQHPALGHEAEQVEVAACRGEAAACETQQSSRAAEQ